MTSDKNFFDGLSGGSRPRPSDLLDALEPAFPLISQMAGTSQDPEWHSEGNVRITSPRHAARGRSYVAPRLPALGFSEEVDQRILAGIGHHHDPRKLISRDAPKSAFWRFSRNAEAKMIYLLELADTRGRIHAGSDADESNELFRLACEDFEIWDVKNPYEKWDERIRSLLQGESESAVEYTLSEARRQFENGEIHTPEEAISKTHAHRGNFPELVVTCAPSGSGKSCWIDRILPDHLRISLDLIREELTGRRDRMTMEGQVMQLAKKRLRTALAAKQKVVWDATSLRLDGRSAIVGLGHDYHALTTVVAFATPPEILFRRNHERAHPIPNAVIERQLDSLEWPTACEAHRFITIR